MQKVLQLDPRDNVLIALNDLKQGDQIEFRGTNHSLVSSVPAKHKFAIADLPLGADVIMYGVLVGKTFQPVKKGELLTLANLRHESAEYQEKAGDYRWNPPDVSRWRQSKFLGYRRSDGQVGTRNYWLVVPLVFCENRNIIVLKQAFEEELGFAAPQLYRHQVSELATLYREGRTEELKAGVLPANGGDPRRARVFKNIDGIKFLVHQGGCGGTREDSNNLCGLIAGYINHPNVAGFTVLSLGCQHAQIGILRQQLRKRAPNFDKPLFILEQQQSGTEFAMLSEAIQRTFLGLVEANQAERTPAAISHLCVGLKCGGSDGFYGLSANPAIGHTADLLIALGGRTI